MKIERKLGLYENEEFSIAYFDYDIKYFLQNYNKLSNKEYYDFLCKFYNFQLDDSDYINFVNLKTGEEFDRAVEINTEIIKTDIASEGSGRDFSWWTVKERMGLKVLLRGQLQNLDRIFTVREIKKLISEKKIYPLQKFYVECNSNSKEKKFDDDIDCLIKNTYGKIDTDAEYFDFVVNNIRKRLDLNDIIEAIRTSIIKLKVQKESELVDCQSENASELLKLDISSIDNLIDNYNQIITSLYSLNNQADKIKANIISKNPVELVVNYISRLSTLDKDKWYNEISSEQIVNIIATIDYEKEKELCKKIEKMVVELGDSALCLELAETLCDSWINIKKMMDVVISNEDELDSYYFLEILSDYINRNYRKKLLKVIIDSNGAEVNYRTARMSLPEIDVREHGKAVIRSKNLWYNYTFALDIKGADVKGHGNVIIDSNDIYYNYLFATEVPGADIERHRNVVILSKEENEYQKKLMKRN